MKQIMMALMLLFTCSALRAQQYPALHLSDPHPAAGRQVWVSYDPSGTTLQAVPKPVCRVFYYDKDRKTGEVKLVLQQEGQQWKAALAIPENVVMIHVLPESADGQQADNNKGAGYLFPVYKGQVPLPFAFYRMSVLAGGIPLDDGRLKKDPSYELSLMKQEFKWNPSSEVVLKDQFYNQLINSPEPEDKQLLIAKLSALKSTKEPELMMTQVYLKYLGIKDKADSLDRLLRSKFPKGRYVLEQGIETIKNENDPDKKLVLARQLMKDFPEDPKQQPQDFLRVSLYLHLAEAMLAAGSETQVSDYLSLISNKNSRAEFYNKAALQYLKKKEMEQALKYGEKAVVATDTTGQQVYWESYTTMGNIYYEQKAYHKGLDYAGRGYVHLKNKDATTTYVKLLMADGQFPEAQAILETSVKKGTASVQMKTLLKQLFDGRSGNSVSFETYLTGLQQSKAGTAVQRPLKEPLVKEQVTAILLKDVNGKSVDLASYKGKTVVLDFWATWCKPCIQSFPAMQKVIEKYPDVVFLYIATFEKGDATALVKQFKKENESYSFNYLIDEQLKDSSFKAYTNYKVSGVPYKIVLDQAGNIRFRSGGFSGNDDGLINELSAVIEQLKTP